MGSKGRKSVAVMSAFVCSVSSGACTLPAQWAIDMQNELQCGMALDEVKQAVDKPVTEVYSQEDHYLVGWDGGRTMVEIAFEADGLRYMQTFWTSGQFGYDSAEESPIIDLCERE